MNFGKFSPYRLRAHGIVTFGQLRRAVEDGSLIRIKGIGPKAFEQIRQSIERLPVMVDSAQPAQVTSDTRVDA